MCARVKPKLYRCLVNSANTCIKQSFSPGIPTVLQGVETAVGVREGRCASCIGPVGVCAGVEGCPFRRRSLLVCRKRGHNGTAIRDGTRRDRSREMDHRVYVVDEALGTPTAMESSLCRHPASSVCGMARAETPEKPRRLLVAWETTTARWRTSPNNGGKIPSKYQNNSIYFQ